MQWQHGVYVRAELTKDPEFDNEDGWKSCRLSLAVGQSEVHYIDVFAVHEHGEICEEYLEKGREVLVDTRLLKYASTDREGATRSRCQVYSEIGPGSCKVGEDPGSAPNVPALVLWLAGEPQDPLQTRKSMPAAQGA